MRTVHTVICVGPPLAGKTTLLAAWYNELRRNPAFTQVRIDLQPGENDSNNYLADVVEGIEVDGRGPPRNEEGSIHQVRLLCTSKIRPDQIEALEFHDFSGETFRSALAAGANAQDARLSESERRVIAVCQRADLLIFVLNVEDFCRENANPLYENLSFIDSFFGNRAIRLQLEHTCSIYLTHCDQVSAEQLAAVIDELKRMLGRKRLSAIDGRIYGCASVRRSEDGRVHFADKGDPLNPGPAIARWMVQLIEQRGTGGLPRWLVWLAAAVLLIAAAGIGAQWMHDNLEAERAWERHLETFGMQSPEQLETLDPGELKQLRDELIEWKRVALQSHAPHYTESPVRSRALTYRDQLDRAIEANTPVPVAVPQLEKEVRQLWLNAGTKRGEFYRRLEQWAGERMTATTYDRESRVILRQLAEYAQRVNQGVHLEVRNLRVVGPQLSGRLSAEGTLLLSLHISTGRPPYFAGAGEIPLDQVSGVLLSSATAVRGSPGAGKISYAWQGPEGPSMKTFHFGDEVWLRGYRSRPTWLPGRSGELFAFALTPSGADGFADGKAQQYTREFDGNRFSVELRVVPVLRSGESIEAPAFLRAIIP